LLPQALQPMAIHQRKQIFPKEILEYTAQVQYFRQASVGTIIYSLLWAAIALMLTVMPFLKVDIYSSSTGIIKPDKERISLTIIHSGLVVYTNMAENQYVNQGDTILVVDNNGIDEQEELCRKQLVETESFMEDLTRLLAYTPNKTMSLLTNKYRRSYNLFKQELFEYEVRRDQMQQDFKRKSTLYARKVISRSEYEQASLELNILETQIQKIKKFQLNTWQSELAQLQDHYLELSQKERQLRKTKNQYVITAPVHGSLRNVQPLNKGVLVSSGAIAAEISPNAKLLAECYITPRDIGLISKELPIKFQVDAYNHHQWGLLNGSIKEIAKDVELINDQPLFKVRCRIDHNELTLKNGTIGHLKKGMTVIAHFRIAQRTLWELLYDKTEDWLDPKQQLLTHY
jgi:HlyD family secretion protein